MEFAFVPYFAQLCDVSEANVYDRTTPGDSPRPVVPTL